LRLWRAWLAHVTLMLVGLGLVLHFLLVTARKEIELQGRTAEEYVTTICWLYVRSVATTMFVQEPTKVLVITLVSPQVLPSVDVIRATTCREAVRLFLRGMLSVVYSLVLLL
jgi:hypothetical protein